MRMLTSQDGQQFPPTPSALSATRQMSTQHTLTQRPTSAPAHFHPIDVPRETYHSAPLPQQTTGAILQQRPLPQEPAFIRQPEATTSQWTPLDTISDEQLRHLMHPPNTLQSHDQVIDPTPMHAYTQTSQWTVSSDTPHMLSSRPLASPSPRPQLDTRPTTQQTYHTGLPTQHSSLGAANPPTRPPVPAGIRRHPQPPHQVSDPAPHSRPPHPQTRPSVPPLPLGL